MLEDKRSALEKHRRMIKTAEPEAIQTISHYIPAIKHQGHLLFGFGASKNHCAFILVITSALNVFKGDLREYEINKGSI